MCGRFILMIRTYIRDRSMASRAFDLSLVDRSFRDIGHIIVFLIVARMVFHIGYITDKMLLLNTLELNIGKTLS